MWFFHLNFDISFFGCLQSGNILLHSLFFNTKDAYQWLRMNTPSGTRVISWWDYGYQLTGLANATVFVDNFTVNYYRIAIVGLIMSGNEDLAVKVISNAKNIWGKTFFSSLLFFYNFRSLLLTKISISFPIVFFL